MADIDWKPWLAQLNNELFKGLEVRQGNYIGVENITPEVIASGWFGYPGATEEQITRREAHLGKTLPPSYRTFLKASNGFRVPGFWVARLLSVEEIEWFRVIDQELAKGWDELYDLSDTLQRFSFE